MTIRSPTYSPGGGHGLRAERRAVPKPGGGLANGGTGFTLIEMMITVAIVAILAAVAYPSYQSSVLKGKRAEGRTALLGFMQQQERYMTQTGAYAAVAVGATGQPFKTFSGDDASRPSYRLGAAACDDLPLNTCVRVVAEPTFPDPEAGSLSLTSTGTRSCTGTKPALCWR